MRYSFMTYTVSRTLGGRVDMVELCRMARRLGFDTMDQVTLYGRPATEVRRIAEDHGLRIICYTFDTKLGGPDPAATQAGLEQFRQGIEDAVTLGAPMVMVPFGGKPGLSRDQVRRNVIAALREALPIARRAGVRVSAEHFPDRTGPFTISADFAEVTAELPDFFITFDCGSVLTGGEDLSYAYRVGRERIIHMHFKDYRLAKPNETGVPGLDGRTYRPALIGEGLVDYPTLLRTIREGGYDGYANIEYEGTDYPPEDAIRQALDYLRMH